jgi:hypothetical protein
MIVLSITAAISVVFAIVISWLYKKSKLVKENETFYKYKVSGFQKLLAILKNPYARQAIWSRWMIKLGLKKQLGVGSLAPEVDLVSLDGKSTVKLIAQYAAMAPDVPLIVNMGSYN